MSESGPLFVDDGEIRLPSGTMVAGTVVQGEMARGGMAIVYRTQREDGSLAVLKVGTLEAATRPGVEQRYRNEERMGARLRHPNIVRPLAVGRLDGPAGFEGRMFLLTPYVDAPSLSHFMMYHAGGVPMDKLWPIGRQISGALVAMHDVGIVHRDIKPDNVLVGDDGHVHVIDFGLAFSLGDVGGEKRSEELTLAGDAPGTPLYMSPQQAMHEPVSRRFDLYAFGVLLYEMCCGSAPHGHLPLREIAAARIDEKSKPMSLRLMAPWVPVSLVTLIERCMAYDPEQRPTAEETFAFFGSEKPDERTTAPELRVVRPPAEQDESSDPTMLMRRPPVVAEGAREAGDQTMAKLVRDSVAMPSVGRVHAELAKVDERIVVPKVQLLAAVGSPTNRRASVAESSNSAAVTECPVVSGEEPGEEAEGRGLWLAVALLVFVFASLTGWFLLSGREQPGMGEAAPAAVVPPSGLSDDAVSPSLGEPPVDVPVVSSDLGGHRLPSRRIEPESESESEPETEGSVENPPPKAGSPRLRKKKTVTPLPAVADVAAEDTEACVQHRRMAKRAAKSNRSRDVLRHTRKRQCWKKSAGERDFLRTAAFHDLAQYSACVLAGRSSAHAQARSYAKLCATKL